MKIRWIKDDLYEIDGKYYEIVRKNEIDKDACDMCCFNGYRDCPETYCVKYDDNSSDEVGIFKESKVRNIIIEEVQNDRIN